MNEDINLELMNMIRLTENVIKRTRQENGTFRSGYGRIMSAIYHNSGITQSKLAQILEIRPQSLTRALSQLEEEGLIYRKRSEDDKRSIGVYISEKGLSHRDEVMDSRKNRADLIFDCLEEEDKKELLDLLSKVVNTYNQSEKEGRK